MSLAPAFVPAVSEPFAHHLHRLARGGLGAPLARGYVREDNALRKAAGKAWARAPEIALAPDDTVEAALTAQACPPEDAAWFHHRWGLGEGASVETHAARLAAEANTLACARPLLPRAPLRLLVSVAMGSAPVVDLEAGAVTAAPSTHGWLIVLAAIAAELARLTPLAHLAPPDRQLVLFNAAGSALLRLPQTEPVLEALLAAVGPSLMAPVGGEAEYAARLDALVGDVLDQPIGELQRMQKGLTKRRNDRLHRAWLRDFFVPRGLNLSRWVEDRIAAS